MSSNHKPYHEWKKNRSRVDEESNFVTFVVIMLVLLTIGSIIEHLVTLKK